ncbi:MAG TPA: hypothetical protein VGP78_08190 [Solirubrobacteraceae bacterium]|jgi:hypothetical protein|nr:hypothetical protein [Solirubrobacteraceae bacterium]
MRDPASSPLRAVLAVLAAAVGTTLFWTLVTGDLGEAAGYGLVVLIIMGGWLAIELRRAR